jgi:hypothetical protein
MCKNYYELDFTHFVVATAEGDVFGSARQEGHIYNFLIRDGSVYGQTGEQWIVLDERSAEVIRERAQAAYGCVPTYHTRRFLN